MKVTIFKLSKKVQEYKSARVLGFLALLLFYFCTLVPVFVPDAQACGGWWDPCCPWYDPERCAAFDQQKRQKAAENEAYFARQEERLRNLNRVVGLLVPGFVGWAITQATDGAKAAKEANAAVARDIDPGEYAAVSEWDYINELNDNAYWLVSYGYYAALESRHFTACMQETGESWEYCQQWYWAANYGASVIGWLHGQMGYNLEVIAWQIESWYGNDYPYGDVSYWLRDMARQSYETQGAFQ